MKSLLLSLIVAVVGFLFRCSIRRGSGIDCRRLRGILAAADGNMEGDV